MQIANAGGIYWGLIAGPIKRVTFGPIPLENWELMTSNRGSNY